MSGVRSIALVRRSLLRDFRHRPAEFRRPRYLSRCDRRKGEDFLPSTNVHAGPALALEVVSINVFRAALFSIALTVAFGQNASLLGKVWCPDTTSAECPHQNSTTSPSVSAHNNCRSGVGGAVAFVREDARLRAGAPDAQNALAVPRFLLAPSHTDLGSGFESGRRLPLEERPLGIALRI